MPVNCEFAWPFVLPHCGLTRTFYISDRDTVTAASFHKSSIADFMIGSMNGDSVRFVYQKSKQACSDPTKACQGSVWTNIDNPELIDYTNVENFTVEWCSAPVIPQGILHKLYNVNRFSMWNQSVTAVTSGHFEQVSAL